MSAIITATVKSGNTSFKTANLVVEEVIRNATANLIIKDATGKMIGSVKRGATYYLSISGSSGLTKGDVLKASLVSTGADGKATEELGLASINYVNGSECIWTFIVPSSWATSMVALRVQHVNYYGRIIGTAYCNAYA